MLSEGILKIDVCCYLEENWPLIDWWHISDVLAGYSRFLGKRKEYPFPLVFIQKYVNVLRHLMAYTHILNMPKHQNGT